MKDMICLMSLLALLLISSGHAPHVDAAPTSQRVPAPRHHQVFKVIDNIKEKIIEMNNPGANDDEKEFESRQEKWKNGSWFRITWLDGLIWFPMEDWLSGMMGHRSISN